ncbi:MAG: DNA replication and repair protein RecF [bacterium]|nr:DNA replication and repair protein RecF [bacterium]
MAKVIIKTYPNKQVRINHLSLYNFKNHAEIKIDFKADITCITGKNGIGKTNILDAVYLLSTCKSYYNAIDYQLIKHGETICAINADFSNGQQYDLQMQIENGKKKKLKKNDKFYEKLIDHIGLINAVIITPGDIELVLGLSEDRRRYIDICISQCDRVYLNCLSEYNKVLDQRNRQLKLFAQHRHFDEILLDSFNAKLIPAGKYIFDKRVEVLSKINGYFNEYYQTITSGSENVSLRYDSDLLHQNFEQLLRENTDKDLALERTSKGLHKDDLVFEINGYPLKKFGSEGQSKSFIIALKLAQYRYLTEVLNTPPILLLDDLFEKIDEQRAQQLIDLISTDKFGQILITDTHEERVRKHFENALKSINFVGL